MPGNKPAAKEAAIFNDYASLLSLMRTTTKKQCDFSNPRTLDFYEALEVAWTAAMLLVMEMKAQSETDQANAA